MLSAQISLALPCGWIWVCRSTPGPCAVLWAMQADVHLLSNTMCCCVFMQSFMCWIICHCVLLVASSNKLYRLELSPLGWLQLGALPLSPPPSPPPPLLCKEVTVVGGLSQVCFLGIRGYLEEFLWRIPSGHRDSFVEELSWSQRKIVQMHCVYGPYCRLKKDSWKV